MSIFAGVPSAAITGIDSIEDAINAAPNALHSEAIRSLLIVPDPIGLNATVDKTVHNTTRNLNMISSHNQ
jgi:hypothetical protein